MIWTIGPLHFLVALAQVSVGVLQCVAGVLQCVAMSHELFTYRVSVWELPSSAMLALVNVSVLQCVSLCCSVSQTVYSYNAIKRLKHREVSFIGLNCVYMGLIRVYTGLFFDMSLIT